MKRRSTHKSSRSADPKRAELLSRLCAVLLRENAKRECAAVRAEVIRAALSAARVDYRETGNPLYLFNGFLTATRAEIVLPGWIARPMAAAIEMCLSDKGKITLDEALDFPPNKGRNRWEQAELHDRDARIKWLFDQELNKGLPLHSDRVDRPSAVRNVAQILELDSDKHDSLLQTWHKRIRKHSSSRSR